METESKPMALMARCLLIDAVVLFLVLASRFSAMLPFWGGLAIIVYLFVRAFSHPTEVFYLVLGTKLTYDALWFVKIPGVSQLGLLEVYLLPVLVVTLLGLKSVRTRQTWIFRYASVYLAWVFLAMVLNGTGPDVSLLVRQSGILLGLIVGIAYLKSEKHLHFVLYLIFISTIVPLIASLAQLGLSRFGFSILHFKADTVRGLRPAGLYYDPATVGMVCLLSLASNLYLINLGRLRRRRKAFHVLFLFLNMAVVIVGGTRAIIIAALLILAVSAMVNLRQTLKFVPLVAVLILVFWSSLSRIVERTTQWEISENFGRSSFNLQDTLSESEYRTMFSGRVSIWQDVWKKFNEGTVLQRFFGSGLSSNAHSSYFFLLLQIGALGLLFYMVIHIRLARALLRENKPFFYKTVGLSGLMLIIVIGMSMTAVTFTSFQWINYLMLGGVLNTWTAGRDGEAGDAEPVSGALEDGSPP